jgi:hypothetical protein
MTCRLQVRLLGCAAALALGLPATAAGAVTPSCAAKGSKTLASNSTARVFERAHEEGDRLYGCLRSVGRRIALADAYDDGYVESGAYDQVRLAGRFVVFRYTAVDMSCKAACPPGYDTADVDHTIFDLRRRKFSTVEDDVLEGAVALSAYGGAWIERTRLGPAVIARDRKGQRVLDRGDVASLTVSGSTVRWTQSGAPQQARLR